MKRQYDESLSKIAFKFNLRRYNEDFNITSTFDGATDPDSSNLTFRITCAPSLGRAVQLETS